MHILQENVTQYTIKIEKKQLSKFLPSESVQRFDPCLLLLHSLLQLGSDCSVDERAWISQILKNNYMSVKYKITKICAHIFQFVG